MRDWVVALIVCVVAVFSPVSALVQEDQKYVRIEMLQYDPPYLQAKVGEAVTWVNSDRCSNSYGGGGQLDCKVHTASAWVGDNPDSPELLPGERFTTTFAEAGVYHVHCARHVYIQGVVVVT